METEALNSLEVDTLLRERGWGTLSFAADHEAYAVPMAFGYDGGALYFQLEYNDDSRKMAYLDATDVATFTTCRETTPVACVMARGTVERVSPEEREAASEALAANAVLPALNVNPEQSVEELSISFYQLRPTELSGRRFGVRAT
jgi:hypothetical protein